MVLPENEAVIPPGLDGLHEMEPIPVAPDVVWVIAVMEVLTQMVGLDDATETVFAGNV